MTEPAAENEIRVRNLVDHLFRREAGRMVAVLTRILGPERMQLAEDVVQEALLTAVRKWPYGGIPENPGGWLMRAARNRALDALRRESTLERKKDHLIRELTERQSRGGEPPETDDEIQDSQLRMMFMCVHPVLRPEVRTALTLKTLGGFGVSEIARAFLARETTIAQRLVRAKRRLREAKVPFVFPEGEDMAGRLGDVLDVIYLIFNEGYGAHEGENLIRTELCNEAVRLAELLTKHPGTARPRVFALLSLMQFQAARLPARTAGDGGLLLLAEQDRSLWDGSLIRKGLLNLNLSSRGDEGTEYHLEAGIAACHCLAETYEDTDWKRILDLYNLLARMNPSPVVALNRAVALAEVHGPREGLRALDSMENAESIRDYFLLPATYAVFHQALQQGEQAAACYREALRTARNESVRRFMTRKLAEIGALDA